MSSTQQSKAICQTCPYYAHLAGDEFICRKSAPQQGGRFIAVWPIVAPDDWCGEHPEKASP